MFANAQPAQMLAPDIVEAILDGRQPEGMRLEDPLEGFPVEWKEQARVSQGSWSE